MRVLLDSTVLVAGLVEDHPDHGRALRWLQQARSAAVEACVASHSLLETFAVLTRLPVSPRITPAAALALLGGVIDSVRIVTLGARDYRVVLDRCAERDLAGGVVYDALIARAAEKADAERLVTGNPSHFERVGPESGTRIVSV